MSPESTERNGLATPSGRFAARLGTRPSAAVLRDKVLAKERELFVSTVEQLLHDPAPLAAAALLVGARRRFIAGDGKSRAYASLLAADLGAGMSNVHQVDNASLSPIDVLSDVRDTDVLVCFSFGRYRSTSVRLADAFVEAGGRLIGVTDGTESPLASLADPVIILNTESESYAKSQTSVALLCHLLSALTVASAKGAKRRLGLRDQLAERLELYWEEDAR